MARNPLVRDFLLWVGALLLLIALPFVFTQNTHLSVLSRMGIAVVFALSYNMLFGQGGMLSFGHAAFAGLGAYLTIHALGLMNKGALAFPVTLLPLVGGLAGMLFTVPFAYVATKRSGTPFAMITLGIGELVSAAVLMLPGFFGGEAGITGNRVTGNTWLGIDYGSQRQMYYLVAAWAFASTAAMYAFTRTPLGLLCNAVRDNAERTEFLAYNPKRVRFLVMVVAGFFAGISGALAALTYEIVNAESVGLNASGNVLLMAFIGGIGQFFGPILGAILLTLLQSALSLFTPAWLLYIGLLFLAMMLFAPGGLSSIIVAHGPAWRAGLVPRLLPSYLAALAAGAVLLAGTVGLVEMLYFLSDSARPAALSLAGLTVDPGRVAPWIVSGAVLAAGCAFVRFAAAWVAAQWQQLRQELNARAPARPARRSAVAGIESAATVPGAPT
ncbi:MAG TPA: branched-chain amino acid ABC transporter permease [Ramlibacter sp.]|nr:branched-chain amino acid ABC transporter permease [Ramlibacter sp.]